MYEVFADRSKEALLIRRLSVNIESLVFDKELSVSFMRSGGYILDY